jgi:hypothetical protein
MTIILVPQYQNLVGESNKIPLVYTPKTRPGLPCMLGIFQRIPIRFPRLFQFGLVYGPTK